MKLLYLAALTALIAPFFLRAAERREREPAAPLADARASDEDHFERLLNVNFRRAPLTEVLKELEDRAGLHFVWSGALASNPEPVTFAANRKPVSEIVQRILWPRGLVALHSEGTLVTLASTSTYAGMAKCFGQALRTLAGLAEKIERAEVQGDGVSVPGWSDDDDRALAAAAADIGGAIYYFRQQQTQIPPYVIERLTFSPDGDARAGALLPLMMFVQADAVSHLNYSQVESGLTSHEDCARHIQAAAQRMAQDPDAIVRACGVAALASWRKTKSGDASVELEAAVADPSPFVRLAAAYCGCNQPGLSPAARDALRGDASDVVRFMIFCHESGLIHGGDTFKNTLPAEKNPAFRALMALALSTTSSHAVPHDAAQRDDDAWFSRVAAACATLTGDGETRTLNLLLGSQQPSHRALGAAAVLLANWNPHKGSGDCPPALAALPLKPLANSDYLWTRCLAALASARVKGDEALRIQADALSSPEPALRMAALAGVLGSRRPDLPLPVKSAIFNAFKQPLFAEHALATEIISAYFPGDEVLALMRTQIQNEPHATRTALLLHACCDLLARENAGAMELLLGDVLKSGDAALQRALIQRVKYLGQPDKFIIRLVRECAAPAVPCAISEFRVSVGEAAVKAFQERLEEMFCGDNAAERRTAMAAFASLYPGTYLYRLPKNAALRAQADALLLKMLARVAHGEAEDSKAALALLDALAQGGRACTRDWKALPPLVHDACLKALAQVQQGACRPLAVQLLLHLMEQSASGWEPLRNDPPLSAAVAAAAELVARDGSMDEQCQILGVAARNRDREAIAKLAEYAMTGKAGCDGRYAILRHLRNQLELAPAAFVDFLFARLEDQNEPPVFRDAVFALLSEEKSLAARLSQSASRLNGKLAPH